MKSLLKLITLCMFLLTMPAILMAQAPQKFNYQGVARDAKGNPMSKQQLALKLSVLPSEDATVAEYEETQMVTTNEFGLYTLQIGNGTPISGTMKAVKWETGNKYIKVAIDPQGGTNYQNLGTTQLLSVPYALYADNAGSTKDRSGTVSTSASGTGTANYVAKFTAANTIYNSQLYDNGTRVAIGTTTPSAKFEVSQNLAGVQEHIRMQNLSATGAGRFTLYSDGASNYSTFTKYGSGYAGGYAGISSLYPYGNLLAFGNNGLASGDGLGRFLISTAGNVGISVFKSGNSKLKFHADFTTLNVGIGGNSVPVARVHMNNTDGATMDTRLTNNTSGHTATDGLEISEEGTAARINNKENDYMSFGTNNAEQMRITSVGDVLVGATSTPYSRMLINNSTSGSKFTLSLTSTGRKDNWLAFNNIDGYKAYLGNYLDSSAFDVISMAGTDINIGTGYIRDIKIRSSDHTIGLGTATPSPYYKVTVQPDNTNGYGGIRIEDAVDGDMIYSVKSGLNGNATFGKLSTTSSVEALYAYVSSPISYAASFGGGILSYNYGNNSSYAAASLYASKARAVSADADSNQAGVFTAGSSVYSAALANGVLRGEYSTGNYISDVPGVSGYSIPSLSSNYGIGVRGEGGYRGVYGYGHNTGANASFGVQGYAVSSTGISYGVYGSAGGGGTNYAGYFSGTLYATTGTFGTKPFTIDHPLDPANKFLRHSSIESNDMMDLYNGNVTTDANGFATVTLPNYFEALNENFKYQLTVIGTFAQAIIKEEVANNQFVIQTNQPNVKVSWQVSGVRHDAVAKKFPIIVEENKPADQVGKYLEPEAYGVSKELGMAYDVEHQNAEASQSSETPGQAIRRERAEHDARVAAEKQQVANQQKHAPINLDDNSKSQIK